MLVQDYHACVETVKLQRSAADCSRVADFEVVSQSGVQAASCHTQRWQVKIWSHKAVEDKWQEHCMCVCVCVSRKTPEVFHFLWSEQYRKSPKKAVFSCRLVDLVQLVINQNNKQFLSLRIKNEFCSPALPWPFYPLCFNYVNVNFHSQKLLWLIFFSCFEPK